MPTGQHPALVEGEEPVGHVGDEAHVVLDDDEAGVEGVADAEEERAERLGLALGDARRRLVEQDDRRLVGEHARQVDDAA